MPLFITIDASADLIHESFALPQGSVVHFSNSAKMPGSYGMPPRVQLNVLEGADVVESLGDFQEGRIVPDNSGPSGFHAQPPIPSTGSTLLLAKGTGNAVVEVVASFGLKSTITRFHLTVTSALPDPEFFDESPAPAGLLIG